MPASRAAAPRAEQYGSDSAPLHITWQMQPTQSPNSSVPSVKAYYTSHIEAWSKAHPDVFLDVSYNSTDINASMTRMQEQAAAGRAPDLAMLDSFFLSRFFERSAAIVISSSQVFGGVVTRSLR